jgi:hypothetical protein
MVFAAGSIEVQNDLVNKVTDRKPSGHPPGAPTVDTVCKGRAGSEVPMRMRVTYDSQLGFPAKIEDTRASLMRIDHTVTNFQRRLKPLFRSRPAA